jgi:hypothetical protein
MMAQNYHAMEEGEKQYGITSTIFGLNKNNFFIDRDRRFIRLP